MKKLLELQKKIGAITKDSKNPFFKSNYFDINKLIEEVKPVLNELGLIITQPLSHIEGKAAIKTILIDSESGEHVESLTPLPESPDPQKMGSAITYYRRYALQSLLFLQAEDDDANRASGKVAAKVPTQQPSQAQAATEEKVLCRDCGSEKVLSQAGKLYCKAKCWLKPENDMPF